MYFVYVIKSLKTNWYYKGLTNNLERRLKDHNSGKTSSNRDFRPFRLVYVEICESLKQAQIIEKYLKSGYGREIVKEIDADVAELAYAIA